MVAGLLWQLRVWRMRVVAASGRDYWQSILVGSVLHLRELLLMTCASDEMAGGLSRRYPLSAAVVKAAQ